jgi:trans-aconitate 2-methyltransferase
MARDWDAASYDRLRVPMTGWGATVVGWLDLAGDERVLDAGCGTGQVTRFLLDRLPRGEVIALDGSPSMIDQARERFAGDTRVRYLIHDLLDPIPIEPVDAILSTATFHWIPDHDRLFANLAAVLKPGGQLAAQCGGAGNIANVASALAQSGHDIEWDKVFATPKDTRERLHRAGFTDVECWLHEEPTIVPPEDLVLYLRTICLGGVLDDLPEDEHERIVREVADRLPTSTIEYVRLNIRARRAG